MPLKVKKIQRVFIIYWTLLAYIIAALVWWFIVLNRQNAQMSSYKMQNLRTDDFLFREKKAALENEKKLKTAQYLGEGGTFLLLILAGAVTVFRAVRRELRAGVEQQHFMMAITHELKTPIAVSMLNLETLQKRRLDETQQQRLLRNTLDETVRLDNLCNNLLLSSQIEAGGYHVTSEEQNLSAILERCIDKFITRHPHRALIKDIEPNVVVKGDGFLLQIAVDNLLENAIKYSPKEKPVTAALAKHGALVLMKFIDEGPGIPQEEKQKIFRKFYRTGNEATKRAKGTGLGLYLVQRIAKTHDGNITIENNPAGGSIFIFSLRADA